MADQIAVLVKVNNGFLVAGVGQRDDYAPTLDEALELIKTSWKRYEEIQAGVKEAERLAATNLSLPPKVTPLGPRRR